MRYWYVFWVANLFIDGLAFARISLVVIVRGAEDLQQLFFRLRKQEAREADQ